MSTPTPCCPNEPRRANLATACGLPVADVHRHKGLLRGVMADERGLKVMFWLPGGRLSAGVAGDYDLRRAG